MIRLPDTLAAGRVLDGSSVDGTACCSVYGPILQRITEVHQPAAQPAFVGDGDLISSLRVRVEQI
jgi:hypothetical protein